MSKALMLAFILIATGVNASPHDGVEGLRDLMVCIPITREDVSVVPHGFYIRSLNEFIHYDHTLPSPRGGGFLVCRRGGDLKFFAPQAVL